MERELSMKDNARAQLFKACIANPLIWSAWEDLYKLCEDSNMVSFKHCNGEHGQNVKLKNKCQQYYCINIISACLVCS